eukprot:SAG11_NODE_950_length_6408_cov_2.671739_4_plen_218_part_00
MQRGHSTRILPHTMPLVWEQDIEHARVPKGGFDTRFYLWCCTVRGAPVVSHHCICRSSRITAFAGTARAKPHARAPPVLPLRTGARKLVARRRRCVRDGLAWLAKPEAGARVLGAGGHLLGTATVVHPQRARGCVCLGLTCSRSGRRGTHAQALSECFARVPAALSASEDGGTAGRGGRRWRDQPPLSRISDQALSCCPRRACVFQIRARAVLPRCV